ncbi:MAG: hypothetical protein GF350_17395 [Chitinivibrionales bacterium]|nr:hypothetical protein [Chitinivibrionales bacterium]
MTRSEMQAVKREIREALRCVENVASKLQQQRSALYGASTELAEASGKLSRMDRRLASELEQQDLRWDECRQRYILASEEIAGDRGFAVGSQPARGFGGGRNPSTGFA